MSPLVWSGLCLVLIFFPVKSAPNSHQFEQTREKEIQNFEKTYHKHLLGVTKIDGSLLKLMSELKNNCGTSSKERCVDIGKCTFGTEYKMRKCYRSRGQLGECCRKTKVPKRFRREGDEGKRSVVEILEEIKEGDFDLNKLGDTNACGFSSKALKGKKVTDNKTSIRDHPWLGALIIKKISLHYCGGALIDKRHILTAAHCVPEGVVPEGILVRLGEYDFNRDNDSKSFDAVVEDIKYHENYDPSTYENDIALIRLEKDVEYNEYVSPICLPKPQEGVYNENNTVIVAGWGKTLYKGNQSEILREVEVPLWNQKTCVQSFTQTVHETSLCAAGYAGGFDSCQGDSGGPLVTQRDDNRWTTVGVVSWGIKCGDKGKPGVYTRVNEYLEWIAKNL